MVFYTKNVPKLLQNFYKNVTKLLISFRANQFYSKTSLFRERRILPLNEDRFVIIELGISSKTSRFTVSKFLHSFDSLIPPKTLLKNRKRSETPSKIYKQTKKSMLMVRN